MKSASFATRADVVSSSIVHPPLRRWEDRPGCPWLRGREGRGELGGWPPSYHTERGNSEGCKRARRLPEGTLVDTCSERACCIPQPREGAELADVTSESLGDEKSLTSSRLPAHRRRSANDVQPGAA